jgi:hypothetical protein
MRRREKIKAGKQWVARLKDKTDNITPALLVLAAHNYAAECQRKGTDGDYIKLPATFLGPSKPYLDYLTSPAPNVQGTGPPVEIVEREVAPEVLELRKRLGIEVQK